MNESKVSIYFHNYYGQHKYWLEFFCAQMTVPFDLYYNIVTESIYNIKEDTDELYRQSSRMSSDLLRKLVIRLSANQGKDIGGKLILIDATLHLQRETGIILFFHDKQSPHKVQNEQWRRKLFRIVEQDFTAKALAGFDNDPQTGIIAAADSIQSELANDGTYTGNNGQQVNELRSRFGLRNKDHRFVAGTMFWARSKPVLDFFRLNPPLDIRQTLEPGNVMDESTGSYTHTWERMLSWIVTEQGYKIRGI